MLHNESIDAPVGVGDKKPLEKKRDTSRVPSYSASHTSSHQTMVSKQSISSFPSVSDAYLFHFNSLDQYFVLERVKPKEGEPEKVFCVKKMDGNACIRFFNGVIQDYLKSKQALFSLECKLIGHQVRFHVSCDLKQEDPKYKEADQQFRELNAKLYNNFNVFYDNCAASERKYQNPVEEFKDKKKSLYKANKYFAVGIKFEKGKPIFYAAKRVDEDYILEAIRERIARVRDRKKITFPIECRLVNHALLYYTPTFNASESRAVAQTLKEVKEAVHCDSHLRLTTIFLPDNRPDSETKYESVLQEVIALYRSKLKIIYEDKQFLIQIDYSLQSQESTLANSSNDAVIPWSKEAEAAYGAYELSIKNTSLATVPIKSSETKSMSDQPMISSSVEPDLHAPNSPPPEPFEPDDAAPMSDETMLPAAEYSANSAESGLPPPNSSLPKPMKLDDAAPMSDEGIPSAEKSLAKQTPAPPSAPKYFFAQLHRVRDESTVVDVLKLEEQDYFKIIKKKVNRLLEKIPEGSSLPPLEYKLDRDPNPDDSSILPTITCPTVGLDHPQFKVMNDIILGINNSLSKGFILLADKKSTSEVKYQNIRSEFEAKYHDELFANHLAHVSAAPSTVFNPIRENASDAMLVHRMEDDDFSTLHSIGAMQTSDDSHGLLRKEKRAEQQGNPTSLELPFAFGGEPNLSELLSNSDLFMESMSHSSLGSMINEDKEVDGYFASDMPQDHVAMEVQKPLSQSLAGPANGSVQHESKMKVVPSSEKAKSTESGKAGPANGSVQHDSKMKVVPSSEEAKSTESGKAGPIPGLQPDVALSSDSYSKESNDAAIQQLLAELGETPKPEDLQHQNARNIAALLALTGDQDVPMTPSGSSSSMTAPHSNFFKTSQSTLHADVSSPRPRA